MSINYHAFQNRGYLFSTHEVLAQQWRDTFAGYDPARVCGILRLKAEEGYLYLTYFRRPYRLRLKDGFLEKEAEGMWTEKLYFNEAMSIYHLLYYTKELPASCGVWVPNTALEGAGVHSRNMPDPLLEPFAARFSGKVKLLDEACERLGGTRLSKGDVSWQFAAFPQIPVQLVFWDADEDFPAQAQVLFDQRVTDYIHFETTGCMISDLLELLEEEARRD